jgi:hypothetical protein
MIDPSQEISEGASHEAVPPESAAGANLQSPAPLTPINAIEPSALSDAVPESKNPMLDVHAPHGSVHTWKDFFIHLATIAIGLLIAIGLEQSVEYLHHRHQVHEMAEKIQAESIENRKTLLADIEQTDRVISVVNGDLLSLATIKEGQDKSAFAATALPTWIGYVPNDTTWLMMRDSSLLSISPELIVKNYFKVEATLAALDRWTWIVNAARNQLEAALQAYSSPKPLSPQERDVLQRVYSEYGVALANYRLTAKGADILISMALNNEAINPDSGRQHGFGPRD